MARAGRWKPQRQTLKGRGCVGLSDTALLRDCGQCRVYAGYIRIYGVSRWRWPPLRADQLATTVRNRLKRIQYRPSLIDGFLPKPGSASNLNRHRHQTPLFQPL
jgi:hypothetical protein